MITVMLQIIATRNVTGSVVVARGPTKAYEVT
jgi:hypothetical protein